MTSDTRSVVSPCAIRRAACAPSVSRREIWPAANVEIPPISRAEPIIPSSTARSMPASSLSDSAVDWRTEITAMCEPTWIGAAAHMYSCPSTVLRVVTDCPRSADSRASAGRSGSSIIVLRASTPVSEYTATAWLSCSVALARWRSPSARPADWRTTTPHVRAAITTDVMTRRTIFQRSDMEARGPGSAGEPVAEAADRLDPGRADLLPQPLDVDVDDAGVAGPLVAPDRVGHLLPRVHVAGLLRQQHEDPQLRRREVDLLVVDLHREAAGVDRERAQLQATDGR